ncbi:Uncharacterized protein FWK35_00020923, partial [Aphis craccivora]
MVHSVVARDFPKTTKDHLFLSNIMKMRVQLMAQVFSQSMACGIEFYRRRKVSSLENSEDTQQFTVFLDNLFDIMEDAEIWLNNWENCVHNQHIYQNEFLTMMTAEGKFFGMIRQATGPNDHPTGPTFLPLYRILSLY